MRFPVSLLLAALCITFAPAQTIDQANRYEHWLAEDAAYIITDLEAAQYLVLKTDADRDQFIIQFWIHRDPTPGTVVNEYKEEHYRRLAYANQHFAEGVTGWKTARGHTYIVEGPPDRVIQRRLSTGEPAEDWIWSSISQARQFTFIDYCKCGRYQRLTDVTDK